MRVLYDSVDAKALPRKAKMVAAYVDGKYANEPAIRKRFPKAQIVTITVLGTPGAHVCDCEPGDLTPTSAAAWAAREIDAGRHPTIYCMASQWPAVKRAVERHGITGKVHFWIADYDFDPSIPVGAIAKQHSNPPRSGGHYDVSSVFDHWPGVDPPKPPRKAVHKPKPPAKKAPVTVVKAHSKSLAALIGGIGTWAAAALADGHVTQNEWTALVAILVPGVLAYLAPKNKPKP